MKKLIKAVLQRNENRFVFKQSDVEFLEAINYLKMRVEH